MSKKISYIGILVSLAVCASWIERLLPLSAPVPGVKLGLANVVTLVTLYLLDAGSAFLVTIARVLIAGALYGGLSGIIYGLAGGILSCAVMAALKAMRRPACRPTVIGVSVAGAVIHNAGQLLVAALVVNNPGMFTYMPVLILSGVAAGVITGICAGLTIGRLKRL